MTTLDANKAIARRVMEEVWNRASVAAVDTFFADDFVSHKTAGDLPDREGIKRRHANTHAGFSDVRFETDYLVAEGDKVAMHWTFTGTYRSGYGGTAPPGTRVSITGINVYRIENGKIAEEWVGEDSLGLVRQIGASV